jgi:hypothetical protein
MDKLDENLDDTMSWTNYPSLMDYDFKFK